MAFRNPGWGAWSAPAENDLSSSQYKALELGSGETVDVADGAADLIVGILQNKPEANEACEILSSGISKVLAGAAVTRGARVGTDASGRAVAKTADADLTFGIALEAASAAGEYISVLLTIGTQRAA